MIHIKTLFFALLLFTVATIFGRYILSLFNIKSKRNLELFLLSQLLGFGITSFLVYGLGLLGLLNKTANFKAVELCKNINLQFSKIDKLE